MDPSEDNNIQAWLLCITQENHTIKAQLNQLMELVHQLLPQQPPAAQATQQATHARNPNSELLPAEEQFPSAQVPSLSLPLLLGPSPERLLWGNHQVTKLQCTPALLCTPQHQNIASPCSWHLPQLLHHRIGLPPSLAYTNSLSGLPHSGWGHHKQYQGTSHQQLAFTASEPPAQVPASIHSKVQCSEYINHSELLVCDFQYKYSGLDDSHTLEIVGRKLSLAPKCKSRHLSTLQLWLKAWHIYKYTDLSFFPNRYQEL